jgi:hypothetical protein
MPAGLCPLAFGNIYPYFVTLSTGGWLTWVQKGDGVIVQCPCAAAGVEFKIFRGEGDRAVTARIVNVRGLCPFGHKKGAEFVFDRDPAKQAYFAAGQLMPYLILLAEMERAGRFSKPRTLRCSGGASFHEIQISPSSEVSGQDSAPDIFYSGENFTIQTSVMKKVCKYHKRKWQEYTPNDVVRSFDMDAFYQAYPYCLALLYHASAGKSGVFRVCHPAPDSAELEVGREPRRNILCQAVKKTFEFVMSKTVFGRPDWEDFDIYVKVTGEGKNKIPGLEKGRKYYFNTAIGRLDEFCPASFYGLYPSLLSYLKGFPPLWGAPDGAPGALGVHCPDHEGMIYSAKKTTP